MATIADAVAAQQLRRRHVIFAVVTIALMMSSIDATIVNVAIPTLRTDLHTNIIWTGWTIAGYQLGQLLILPLAGKMSDEWGRRRVFIAALVIFTLASSVCGLAPNVYVLVIARVVQAIGGGAFMPSCTGIVSELYTKNRVRAIGLFSSVFPLGGILGPNIGGFLIDHFSWRYVFFVNVPLGIFVIIAMRALYRERPHLIRAGMDFIGSISYSTAILTLILAATWVGEDIGILRSPLLWCMFAASVLVGIYFLRHEKRAQNPIIAPELLRHRPLLAANLYNFVFGMATFGIFAYMPTYLEDKYHFSAGEAGALLTPRSAASLVFSIIASVYIIRFGYRIPMIVKCLMQAVTMVLMSLGLHTVQIGPLVIGEVVWLSLLMMLAGAGMGIGQPAATNAALDIFPGQVAAATGIRNMFRLTGGMIGTSMMTVALAVYGQAHEAMGLETIFDVLAVINLICIPIVLFIPDTARQRRHEAQRVAAPDGELLEGTPESLPETVSAKV